MLLAEHFAIYMCSELKLPLFPGFSIQAQKKLLSYPWPGNVRELKNVIEHSVYRHGDRSELLDFLVFNPFADWSITSPTIKQDVGLPALPIDLKQWQHATEKILLEQALQIDQFNQRQTAQQLKSTYYQFRGLLKKHNLPNS